MPIHSTPSKSSDKSFRVVERKLYLNVEQELTLETYRVECCRVYNRALNQRIKAYKRRKETVGLYSQQRLLTKQRKRIDSLRAVPVEFARDALRRLDKAFQAFFRRMKTNVEHKGFPRFRAKHRYRSMEYSTNSREYFRDGTVFIPGIGEVSSRGRDVTGKQKMLRIIKRVDAWYAQVLVEVHNLPMVNPQSSVGIDMGLTAFATLSTGEKIENPRWYRKAQSDITARAEIIGTQKEREQKSGESKGEIGPRSRTNCRTSQGFRAPRIAEVGQPFRPDWIRESECSGPGADAHGQVNSRRCVGGILVLRVLQS